MAEKRGKGPRPAPAAQQDGDPPTSDPSVSDPQVARTRIRQRWEFASVLNFLSVFKSLIGGDLKISAEEIETALVTPNDNLARLHVALLKGIPPVNKKMTEADTWVTVVCKKLATWWPWVAEGENPLNSDHGHAWKEIQRYKDLDPITRMLILKALCEVRALQDDVLSYVSDELKNGTKLTTFRKERIGNVGNGVSYWYDGDPVIGHRLYKEVVQVESKYKSKGKGRPTQPTINYQWETLATDLEEFQKISDNLSASNVHVEAAVGEIIKTEIIPVLAELQKKKERALKRQQREALQLNEFLNYSRVGFTRSCRERRPVRYTFDEYDRSIDEAIQISKKLKTNESKNAKQVRRVCQKDAVDGNEEVGRSSEPDEMHDNLADNENNEFQEDNDEDNDYNEKDKEYKHQSDNDNDDDYNEKGEDKQQSDDDEDDDYDEKDDRGVSNIEEEDNDDDDDSDDFTSSDVEKVESPKRKRNHRDAKSKAAVGVRRSQRFVEPSKGLAETKKRLRQRPTRNSAQVVSDSEDSCPQDNEKAIEMVSDSETEDSAASGDRSQEGSNDDGLQDSGDDGEE